MKITSLPGLRYPFTVQKLEKEQGATVARSDKLFAYYYEETVTESDKWGEEHQVKRRRPGQLDASNDGTITRWFVQPGTVVERAGIELVDIEEPCAHETQYGGLCVDCGKDMTQVDYLTKQPDDLRASINLDHNNIALRVSPNEAIRAEEDTKKRLLGSRKLTLIVDLDQTVIHTTCERTIAEWKADPENPNHEALRDVEGFQLADDNVANVAANWYYVKMRPGLKGFFDRVSKLYEMHVYTMATRAYAEAVMKIIDPERKYFGDRVLSRDENYTDKLKNLTRLFYQNTNMVVIIDDRADVWQYSPHLVRVPVFNFFPGAGDINASFLPKQQELVTQSKDKVPIAPQSAPKPVVASSADISVAGDGGEDIEQQAKEQEKVIAAQQMERPLLQQQLILDQEDAKAEESETPAEQENGDAQHAEHPKVRHSVLNEDDRGLDIIEKHLAQVHRTFYDEYIKEKTVPAGGRVAELKGEKSPKKRNLSDTIPDVAEIMPRIKEEVLEGAVIVFSGIIPLGVEIQSSDFALWIKSFGAEVTTTVNRRTTHVIANPDRKTTKVKKAARYQNIKIVNPEWMFQCCTRWEHVEETPYLIEIDPAERGGSPFGDVDDDSVGATGDEEVGDNLDPAVKLDNMDPENWAEMDQEMKEWLAESDSNDEGNESDSDSGRSDNSTLSEEKHGKKKRKRSTQSTDVSEAEESDNSVTSTSKLQRRKKRTLERVTSLTNVVTAEKSSGLPSPDTTGPEEGQGEEEEGSSAPNGVAPDLKDDNDDALEAELLAGFGESADEDE